MMIDISISTIKSLFLRSLNSCQREAYKAYKDAEEQEQFSAICARPLTYLNTTFFIDYNPAVTDDEGYSFSGPYSTKEAENGAIIARGVSLIDVIIATMDEIERAWDAAHDDDTPIISVLDEDLEEYLPFN